MAADPLLLGIDIGTSKIAAVIIDKDGELLAVQSCLHHTDRNPVCGQAEQDALILLKTTQTVIHNLPKTLRRQVCAVGVTGQMHGILCIDDKCNPLTPLITWQDQRCDSQFLQSLQVQTGYRLSSGFGCATLAWLISDGKLPDKMNSACTIHDWLVAKFCGLESTVTDPTDAASWGLFDLNQLDWDWEAVDRTGIPRSWLPKVVSSGMIAGFMTRDIADAFGLPKGISVVTAIGDNQASLLATLQYPDTELALTLGTGGQLSAVMQEGFRPVFLPLDSSFEYRPFPNHRTIATASALCGGAAWRWLIETIESWTADLRIKPPSREELYQRLDELGLAGQEEVLKVRPTFLGERHNPSLCGQIDGIGLNNFNLGSFAKAVAYGIIQNLSQMLPASVFQGRKRVVASGNALRKSRLLQQAAQDVLNLELILSQVQEEAACGSAILAQQAL
ncbi:MAG: hypothetical protein JXA82_13810 [Sedimentisphaerales bacterium]|nr:hypothetical protein [Sedimentisphaerales bacterium]